MSCLWAQSLTLPALLATLRSPCADPESFVRGGPNLIVFLVDEEIGDQNTAINGPSSDPPAKCHYMAFLWRDGDGPILNAGLVAL